MVSGFALPLYLVISVIGVMAVTLMLPKPFYYPAVKLCVFTQTNALARTVINTTAGTSPCILTGFPRGPPSPEAPTPRPTCLPCTRGLLLHLKAWPLTRSHVCAQR